MQRRSNDEASACGFEDQRTTTPKVSVAMVTYNHELYIAQAIGSVLSQEADFDFELVIGEDCSTDRTRKICEHYARKFPEIVRLLPSVSNMGVRANAVRTISACIGEYLAILDGDDYWTSPGKLQSQVNLMDLQPEHAVSFHDVCVIPEDPTEASLVLPGDRIGEIATVDGVLNEYFMLSSSIVVRRSDVTPVPYWALPTFGDFTLAVLAANHGTIHHMSEPMSVYRRHSGGVWTSQSPELQHAAWRDCLLAIAANMPRLRRAALRSAHRVDFRIARALQAAGDVRAARRRLWPVLPGLIWYRAVPARDVLQLIIYTHLPALARAQLALRRCVQTLLRGE